VPELTNVYAGITPEPDAGITPVTPTDTEVHVMVDPGIEAL
jgi:hypothetical protein